MGRKLYWLLVLATAVIYGSMLFWAGPIMLAQSGGAMPFDLRMFGYSYSETLDFLAALSPEGMTFYRGTVLRLDTVFPAMFALVLAIGCWILLANKPLILRLGAGAIALIYGLFDYLENAAVARILDIYPDELPQALVAAASRWTILKFFFVDAAITILVVLIIALFVERAKAAVEN